MPTPAKLGRNRHKALIADARIELEQAQGIAGELVAEIEIQASQARPILVRVAVLAAQLVREMAKLRRQLDEMHTLVGQAAELGPDDAERLQRQIDELRKRIEALE